MAYRKVHRLGSASDKQISKLFNLFEGPYTVIGIYNNVAIIVSLENVQQRKECK